LQQYYEAFQKADVEIVALAAAASGPVDGVRQVTGAAYPFLADPDHRVAEAYGVYNVLGDNLAAPAVFIIDTDGYIVWRHVVGLHPGDRPSPEMILEHLP
jgi:peroxiredoxin